VTGHERDLWATAGVCVVLVGVWVAMVPMVAFGGGILARCALETLRGLHDDDVHGGGGSEP